MTDRTKTICPPIFDLGGIKTANSLESIKTVCQYRISNPSFQERLDRGFLIFC